MSADKWWNDRRNLADLIRWMDRDGDVDTQIICDLLYQPWLFNEEWAQMGREQARPPPAEHEDESTLAPMLQASLAVVRGRKEGMGER